MSPTWHAVLTAVNDCLDRVLAEDEIDDRARRRLQSISRDVRHTVAHADELGAEDWMIRGENDPSGLEDLVIYAPEHADIDDEPDRHMSEASQRVVATAGITTIGELQRFAVERSTAEDIEAFRDRWGTDMYAETEALAFLKAYDVMRYEDV